MAFQMKMPGMQGDDVKKSLKQLHSWLFQLNENLQYTLSHLDEENFTDTFLLSLARGGEGGGALSEQVEQMRDQLDRLQNQTSQMSAQLENVCSAGWTLLPLNNCRTYNTGNEPACTRRGNTVYLWGGVALNSTLSNNAYAHVTNLPENMRPPVTISIPVNTDLGPARLQIQHNGYVYLGNCSGKTLTTTTLVSFISSFAL